ncbi:MAG TPA: multiheme c-type cytochrome [Myxococcaceae bacterium]|nr:multiheme c-type cytochrome [Myxococcaceae bacterium]
MQLRSVFIAATLLAACTHGAAPAPEPARPPSPPATRFTVFVTADLRGQIAPCGCSEAMRGGMAKAAAIVAQPEADGVPVLLVDAGDALFERNVFGAGEAVGERRRAQAIADGFRAMHLAVRFAGPLDDALGPGYRRSLGLPDLAPGETRLLEVGGWKVGVVAGTGASELSRGATKVREGGARFVLGLLRGTPGGGDAATGVDLVVAAQAPEAVGTEWEDGRLQRGSVPVAQVQSRGRSLLRLDVSPGALGAPLELARGQGDIEREFNAQGQRLELLKRELGTPGLSADRKRLLDARLHELVLRREQLAALAQASALQPGTFTVRFVPVEAALPDDPEVQKIIADYDRDVAQLNLAWAKEHGEPCPPPGSGEASYVGNEACRSCHPAPFAVYERTGHSHAYATLESVQKQYRLDCVACHVIGFQQAGGVCRVDQVDGRRNVGCESCHGPGSSHVAAGTARSVVRPRPGPSLCVGCHTAENSIHFDYARYLPRVLGPGHGAAASTATRR